MVVVLGVGRVGRTDPRGFAREPPPSGLDVRVYIRRDKGGVDSDETGEGGRDLVAGEGEERRTNVVEGAGEVGKDGGYGEVGSPFVYVGEMDEFTISRGDGFVWKVGGRRTKREPQCLFLRRDEVKRSTHRIR